MANIFTDILVARKITVITDGEKTILACDVIEEEHHEMTAEATEFEVEDGSLISDHVIKKGKTLKLTGMISDDPLTILQTGFLDRTSSIVPQSLKSKLGFGMSGENGKPSKEAFDQLEKIYDEKRPVDIVTGLKKYDTMILEELSIHRTSKTVRSLNFAATLKQINIISTDFTYAPTIKMEAGLGAEKKKNIGKKGTQVTTKSEDDTGFFNGLLGSPFTP